MVMVLIFRKTSRHLPPVLPQALLHSLYFLRMAISL
jgi:hypothetical protein